MNNKDNIYWGHNTENRTSLNSGVTRTLKFTFLFPTYVDFKANLTPFGFTDDLLTEVQFNQLRSMINNAWLKYKTAHKNYGYIVLKMQELIAIQKREQKLYDYDHDALMKNVSSIEQRFFTVNKTAQGVVDDSFLNNANTATSTTTAPLITQMELLMQNTQLKAPALLYLYRIANSIVYPLQANGINENTEKKGGF